MLHLQHGLHFNDGLFLSDVSFYHVFHFLELEKHLAARSSDVSTVAFDIQVFISERAQDLEPEQSRHLLRQLQQLQRAFHQATGRAHARAEALSIQEAREEEREQKEREQEEREREKEKQTAMKKEVCKCWFSVHALIQ